MSLIKGFRYRPEIDGLRAIAVMAVVFFHAELGVPGGYIGVDVFFVISGFLITSLIIKDLEAGTFTLTSFWERRARRIIPAAVVLVLAVLAAAWFLLLPSDYADLGKSAALQAVFAANFYFWRSTNYFAGAAEEQPLLHTWSLAVEEQFYLFVPFVLLLLFRFVYFRRRGPLLAVFGLGFCISLILSVVLVPKMPAAAFYLLPTRAWELLCGSIIAILPAASLSRFWREILCGVALAAIVIPCFLYTKETPFPGLAALPPCLGTALFIWASGSVSAIQNSTFKIQNLLAAKPVVFIGLISYSLYLWHWPLFAFSHYWALEPFSWSYSLCLVAASFVLAILSWRFVEMPFRRRSYGATKKSIFAFTSASLGLVFGCSFVIVLTTGVPISSPSWVSAVAEAKIQSVENSPIIVDPTLRDAITGRFPRLGSPAPAPIAVVVWGDSHARVTLSAIDRICRENGLGVIAATHSSNAPVIDYEQKAKFSLGGDSSAFNRAVIEYIEKHSVPNVLLAAKWDGYFDQIPSMDDQRMPRPDQSEFSTALLETVQSVVQTGANVWVMMDVPMHHADVPKALVHKKLFGTELKKYMATKGDYELQSAQMERLRPLLKARGARIIDVSDLLYDAEHKSYMIENEAGPLYYDRHHLTKNGMELVKNRFIPVVTAEREGLAK